MLEGDLIPLTVPEVRRLLVALAEPDERFSIRLAWSTFRRRHQAIAQRCHVTRRTMQTALKLIYTPLSTDVPDIHGTPAIPAIQVLGLGPGLGPGLGLGNRNLEMNDEQWRRIWALLPPQKPHIGRPSNDHRTILEGMLWIMRNGASWRDLPMSLGSWQTLYTRYQRWNKAGIWKQILDVLNQEQTDP